MATVQHSKTTAVSIFQIDISRNTKCTIKDGFCRDSHILCNVQAQTDS